MVWYGYHGMVWYYLVYGIIWYGMVWYGVYITRVGGYLYNQAYYRPRVEDEG